MIEKGIYESTKIKKKYLFKKIIKDNLSRESKSTLNKYIIENSGIHKESEIISLINLFCNYFFPKVCVQKYSEESIVSIKKKNNDTSIFSIISWQPTKNQLIFNSNLIVFQKGLNKNIISDKIWLRKKIIYNTIELINEYLNT